MLAQAGGVLRSASYIFIIINTRAWVFMNFWRFRNIQFFIATISVSRRRPVLAFVTERHDLGSIREAMATAIARATFFSHSFRVWNWLLKLVSAESR